MEAQPSLSKLLRRAHSLLAQDQLLDPTMASLVSEGTTAAEKTPLASNPLFSDQEGSSRGVVFKQIFCLTIYSIKVNLNHTTSLSCSKWKLDECKNQNPPTNLGFHPAKCNPKFFLLFYFALHFWLEL